MSEHAPPSLESMFALPAFSRAQISPDGRRLAYLAPWRDHLNIWVRPADLSAGCEDRARRSTQNDVRYIEGFAWTRESRYILRWERPLC